MATSAIGSTGEDYSDSFELDEEIESISLGSSFDSSTVSAQVVSRQVESHERKKEDEKSLKAGVKSSVPKLQTRPATRGTNGKTARFKAAAQKVQTMQSVISAARHFSDSLQVRDAAFSEWMSRKQAKMSSEKSEIVKVKKEKEEIKRRKDEELAERSVKAVDKWNAAKTAELRKKQKQKEEEDGAQQLKAKEKEERQLSSKLASEKWREEKTKLLVSQHREKKTKVREEEQKEKNAAAEKEQNAGQALKAWSEKKDRIIEGQRRKQKKEKEELELKKLEEAYIKQEEAQRAVQAWKSKKDEKIKRTGSLYTYTEKEKVHTQAWCPARSMKYSYPGAAKTAISRGERSRSSSILSTSAASLQSEGSYTSLSSTGSSSWVTSPEPSAGNCKGKPKTIQVCCQTLEYWCTCGD